MPELPEVETTLRGVSPHMVGRVIREITVREPRLRWPVPKAIEKLAGQRILTGERRGKYLLFRTAKGTLLIHLGMSGSLRVIDPMNPWRKHDHIGILMDSGLQLRLHDPRRFGAVLVLPADEPESHSLLADLGPEPLAEAFNVDVLQAATRGKTAPIKNVIMDSHVVVGVGNIYACEALFMAGIHPTRAAGRISRQRLDALVTAIREVLTASIEMGGTTLRDFLRENGEPGYFKQTLRAYDREGQPCTACGTAIRRIVLGQRSTYFCPRCQR